MGVNQDASHSIDLGATTRECLCEDILKAWNGKNGVLGNGRLGLES